jgi:hypothetical protein
VAMRPQTHSVKQPFDSVFGCLMGFKTCPVIVSAI